jgi:putative oxidoreductase
MKNSAIKLLKTDDDWTLTIMRIVLGVVFLAHGSQKVLGLWGGHGFTATMQSFTGMGIPAVLAFTVIICEFLGGLGLIVGLLGRIPALGIAAIMTVAILMVHGKNGFFMNWTGQQKGEGFEYHLLVLAMAISILVRGSGALSLDQIIFKILVKHRD